MLKDTFRIWNCYIEIASQVTTKKRAIYMILKRVQKTDIGAADKAVAMFLRIRAGLLEGCISPIEASSVATALTCAIVGARSEK